MNNWIGLTATQAFRTLTEADQETVGTPRRFMAILRKQGYYTRKSNGKLIIDRKADIGKFLRLIKPYIYLLPVKLQEQYRVLEG